MRFFYSGQKRKRNYFVQHHVTNPWSQYLWLTPVKMAQRLSEGLRAWTTGVRFQLALLAFFSG
jgi:hypothetical protein